MGKKFDDQQQNNGPDGLNGENPADEEDLNLFDDADDDNDEDDTEDDGLGSDGDEEGDDSDALVDRIVTAVGETVLPKVNAEIDRRINQALGKSRREKQPSQPSRESGPSRDDVREARIAYRDYVSEEIKFAGVAERKVAGDLAPGLLRAALENGDDPEDAGRKVATAVAGSVRDLRKHYQKQVLAGLTKRGLLDPTALKSGQPRPGKKDSDASSMTSGSEKARQMLAHRQPAGD